MSAFSDSPGLETEAECTVIPAQDAAAEGTLLAEQDIPTVCVVALLVSRDGLSVMQKADPTLNKCFSMVVSDNSASGTKAAYILRGDILMRKWSLIADDSDCDAVY